MWDQHFRSDGANVDDATTLRHFTDANNCLCHVDGTEDVDGELVFELLFLNIHKRSGTCSRGIVD